MSVKAAIVTLVIVLLIIGAIYYYNQGSGLSIIENIKEKISNTTSTEKSIPGQKKTTGIHTTTTQASGGTNTQTATGGENSFQSIIEKVKQDKSKIKFNYTTTVLSDNKFSLSFSWTYDGQVFYLTATNNRDVASEYDEKHIGFYDKDLNALYDVDIGSVMDDILYDGNITSDMYTVYLLPNNIKPIDIKLIVGLNHALVVLNESGDIYFYPVDLAQYKIGPIGDYVYVVIFLRHEPFMQSIIPVKNYTLAHNADAMNIQYSCGSDYYLKEYVRLFYWNNTTFTIKNFNSRDIHDIMYYGLNVRLKGEEKTYDLEKIGYKVVDAYRSLIMSACSIIETKDGKDNKLFFTVPAKDETPVSTNNTLTIGPIFEGYKSIAIKYQFIDEPLGIFALTNNNTIIFQRQFYYNSSNDILTYYSGTVKLDKPPINEPKMIWFNLGMYSPDNALLAILDNKNTLYIYNITIVKNNAEPGTLGLEGRLLFKLHIQKPLSRLEFSYQQNYSDEFNVLESINGERVPVSAPTETEYFMVAYNQFTSNGEQVTYNISYGIQPGS